MAVKIAIIDNGIDKPALQIPLKDEITIRYGKICRDNISIQPTFAHGTNCALIIEKKCSDAELCSVKILDEHGKGLVDDLGIALEWCFENEYYLLNLSFGTTHFKDKKPLQYLIDKYTAKGMIIVAASSNTGYISYPASFGNVIGVVAGDKFGVNEDLQMIKGIDFIAPSDLEIIIDGISIPGIKINSYAAPYVTAMIGNYISKFGKHDLGNVKKHLGALKPKALKSYIPQCLKRERDIDIPLIICKIGRSLDPLWWVCKLRDMFYADGYNAYAVCNKENGLEYGVEYIPNGSWKSENQEKIHDYIFWRSYYYQSDLIIATDSILNLEPDVELHVSGKQNDLIVELLYDGEQTGNLWLDREDAVAESYYTIEYLLTKERNE